MKAAERDDYLRALELASPSFHESILKAETDEDRRGILRDVTKFNLEARKYPGGVPSITMTTLRQAAFPKPEKAFMDFGRVGEGNF